MYVIPYIAYPYYYPEWQVYNHNSLQLHTQFPPVDTKKLHSSAERFQIIMEEARLLIDQIVNTPSFARDLMDAAQLSDHKKVEALIISTGITSKVKTEFSPTGIQIKFDSTEMGEGCCKLEMTLLW